MLQNGSSAEQMDSDDDSMPELVSASDSDSDSPRSCLSREWHLSREWQSRGMPHFHVLLPNMFATLICDEVQFVSTEAVTAVDHAIRYMSK